MSSKNKNVILNFLTWLRDDREIFLCQHNNHSGSNYAIQDYKISELIDEFEKKENEE